MTAWNHIWFVTVLTGRGCPNTVALICFDSWSLVKIMWWFSYDFHICQSVLPQPVTIFKCQDKRVYCVRLWSYPLILKLWLGRLLSPTHNPCCGGCRMSGYGMSDLKSAGICFCKNLQVFMIWWREGRYFGFNYNHYRDTKITYATGNKWQFDEKWNGHLRFGSITTFEVEDWIWNKQQVPPTGTETKCNQSMCNG